MIVNRGFVPLTRKDAATPRGRADRRRDDASPASSASRNARPGSRRPTMPPRNVWFSRDPAPIAKAYGLRPRGAVLIDAEGAGDRPERLPRGGKTRIELPERPPAIRADLVRPRDRARRRLSGVDGTTLPAASTDVFPDTKIGAKIGDCCRPRPAMI